MGYTNENNCSLYWRRNFVHVLDLPSDSPVHTDNSLPETELIGTTVSFFHISRAAIQVVNDKACWSIWVALTVSQHLQVFAMKWTLKRFMRFQEQHDTCGIRTTTTCVDVLSCRYSFFLRTRIGQQTPAQKIPNISRIEGLRAFPVWPNITEGSGSHYP